MSAPRIAVVTGANKGIGYEIARGLGKAPGVLCILGCRNESLGRNAAAQLMAEGCNVVFLPLDIGDQNSIQCFAQMLHAQYGGLDILVNNAAIAFKAADPTPFQAQAQPTIAINFFGTLALTEALIPLIRPGGRIVNVSSISGYMNSYAPALQARFLDPGLTRDALCGLMQQFIADVQSGVHQPKGWPNSCYGVSKCGLTALTMMLARQLQPRNIAVNAMCPGYCSTDMSSHRGHRSPAQGADTAIYLALIPAPSPTGQFWYDRNVYNW
eukprot:CAMPEP_0174304606 /NCGR_PEP_ID=MMETSP0809-20121228/60892_1 /TAXON_ID=73025 ORGANISM="Eutreptiella gymnastica-like, Strain CCMP1594" /NCGR_SAMPLE_ID=MMETSP0809 /ASSEMBLY_ACC=CAM_ASM_000658 /LENGTH=268 /DNA_ID=CAMNT_0015410875 /DNA_START=33 /DNA_END=836 /DNA_ORIENTATION=-